MVTDHSYTYYGEHFIMYINAKSLSCMPEIDLILYVDCTTVKNKNKFRNHTHNLTIHGFKCHSLRR